MQLFLFIIGLVGVVIPEQFQGQQTLGVAFMAIAAVLTVIQILWFLFVARKAKETHDSFFDRSFR